MLTANAIVGVKEQFLSAGFDDYLTKPIDPEKLDKAIIKFLPKELVLMGEYIEEDCKEEKPEDTSELPQLDEFDFEYAIRILQNKEILMITLQDFDKMLGVLPEKLNDFYLNIEDAEMLNLYKIEVHALKSSAAMVGAMLLSKVARLLEVAAIEKDLERIMVLHPILLDEMSKHKNRLLEIFPEVTEKLPIEDMELILGYFEMLNMGVSNEDYGTADFICEEIKKYNYPENVSKKIVELLEKVNKQESEDVLQLIDGIVMLLKKDNISS